MNIKELYKKEQEDRKKIKYNNGGRGEFYGGDKIYTTGFNKKVQPFTGPGYRLNSEGEQQSEKNSRRKCSICNICNICNICSMLYQSIKKINDIIIWFV